MPVYTTMPVQLPPAHVQKVHVQAVTGLSQRRTKVTPIRYLGHDRPGPHSLEPRQKLEVTRVSDNHSEPDTKPAAKADTLKQYHAIGSQPVASYQVSANGMVVPAATLAQLETFKPIPGHCYMTISYAEPAEGRKALLRAARGAESIASKLRVRIKGIGSFGVTDTGFTHTTAAKDGRVEIWQRDCPTNRFNYPHEET